MLQPRTQTTEQLRIELELRERERHAAQSARPATGLAGIQAFVRRTARDVYDAALMFGDQAHKQGPRRDF
jgi:hypothetical protein